MRILTYIPADWSSYIAEFHKLNRALILNAKIACFPVLATPTKASFDPGSNNHQPSQKDWAARKSIKYMVVSHLLRCGPPSLPLQIPEPLHISFLSRVSCTLGWNTQYYYYYYLVVPYSLFLHPKLSHATAIGRRQEKQISWAFLSIFRFAHPRWWLVVHHKSKSKLWPLL